MVQSLSERYCGSLVIQGEWSVFITQRLEPVHGATIGEQSRDVFARHAAECVIIKESIIARLDGADLGCKGRRTVARNELARSAVEWTKASRYLDVDCPRQTRVKADDPHVAKELLICLLLVLEP